MSREPELWFSKSELNELIQRRKNNSAGRQLFYDLMAAAEWCRKQPIPSEPAPGPTETHKDHPVRPGESPYREDYLIAHEAFEIVTFMYERAVQQLSLVYRLTGERMWADRAVEWISAAMNEWKQWGPAGNPLDQFSVRIMNSTIIGCDWLADILPEELRRQCRGRVTEYGEKCLSEWGESLGKDEPWQVSNHYWFNTSMLGLAGLWLGWSDPKWKEVADRCGRKIDRLCDWTIGPDGDYVDKPLYLLYAFRWALPFMVAWHRSGGTDLLAKPVLAQVALWLADAVDRSDMNLVVFPRGYMDRWVFTLLAAKHRLPEVQSLALDLTDSPQVWTEPQYSQWLKISPGWCYLFFDQNLPAQTSTLPSSRWYRSSGWAVFRTGQTHEDKMLMLYAGPTSAKNYHNQGEFYISAFGERLLETPELPIYGYISAHRAIGLQMSNLSGAVLLADGLGQATGKYPHEWPENARIGHAIEPPIGRILTVDGNSVIADLTNAYRDFNFEGMWGCRISPPSEWQDKKKDRLAKFIRRVRFIDGEWIILLDEIESHPAQPVDLEWHFGTHAAVSIPRPAKAVLEKGRAALDIFVPAPSAFLLSVQQAHYSETGKFVSIRLDRHSGRVCLLLAMHIRRRTESSTDPVGDENGVTLPNGRVITVQSMQEEQRVRKAVTS